MYLLHVNQGLKYGEQSRLTEETPVLSFLPPVSVVTCLHRYMNTLPDTDSSTSWSDGVPIDL